MANGCTMMFSGEYPFFFNLLSLSRTSIFMFIGIEGILYRTLCTLLKHTASKNAPFISTDTDFYFPSKLFNYNMNFNCVQTVDCLP